MRRTRRMVVATLIALGPAWLAAQQPAPAPQGVPGDVAQEAVDRWNGANAVRSSGQLEIEAGREVLGGVAVRGGPLTLAGHVHGGVVAIDADVTLEPTARIDGDLLVVGGRVEGQESARIRGAIRIYRQPLRYHDEGDRMVADARVDHDSWWRRLERHESSWASPLRIVQAGPYNRVEGLPINVGPEIHRAMRWGSVDASAAAVVRTATSFASDHGDVGHRVRAEVRGGPHRVIGVGGSLFNVVDPVESWELSDLEVALASFVVRRDYRDYYARQGGNAFVTFYGRHDLTLTAAFGEERWSSRASANPFTIFHGNEPWRANPPVDVGLFHVGTLSLRFDTRNDPDEPWTGWYASADLEHGHGTPQSVVATATARALTAGAAADYSRALIDLRRYNRLGPDAQLNLRAVVGGQLGAGELPLERRLSVDGPGSLPGYEFRDEQTAIDVGTCSVRPAPPGVPAECDRIALGQVEFRHALHWTLFGNWEDWPREYRGAHGNAAWVLFADGGRGWTVGPATPGVSGITYGGDVLPPLSTFRADVGLGLDVSGIGVYAAKAVSGEHQPLRVQLRLQHRF